MDGSATRFTTVLCASGPAAELADKLRLYGQFVGNWDTEVIAFAADGQRHNARGQIHFGWVLQGRAIQDVWMIPRLEERKGAPTFPIAGNWYGTTIRVYDPDIDAWRIYWIDPATNSFRQQIGGARGADIVQEGKTESGGLSRWSFTEIKSDSFRWLGEASPGDANWRLIVEVRATRANAEVARRAADRS